MIAAQRQTVDELDGIMLAQLSTTTIGRLVVSSDEDICVIPVSYVAERDCLVFQVSASFRKAVHSCERMVFHADGVKPDTGEGWSVTVRGSFNAISGYGSLRPPAGFESTRSTWQDHEEASMWIRLRPESVDLRESVPLAS